MTVSGPPTSPKGLEDSAKPLRRGLGPTVESRHTETRPQSKGVLPGSPGVLPVRDVWEYSGRHTPKVEVSPDKDEVNK